MATVIKSTDTERASLAASFNFEDMGRQAQRYLAEVHVRARQAVEQAQREADAVRQRAEAAGYDAAQRELDRLVEARVAERLKSLTPVLGRLAEQLDQAREAWLAHWERSAIELSAAIAERIIRRELSHRPEITLDLVREALRLAAGSPQLRVALHPNDFAALGKQARQLVDELARAAPAQVVSDPTVSAGGCRVETAHGVIDQQIETQLARIVEELG